MLKVGDILTRKVNKKHDGYFQEVDLYYIVSTIIDKNENGCKFKFKGIILDENHKIVKIYNIPFTDGHASYYSSPSGERKMSIGWYPLDALSYSFTMRKLEVKNER